MSIIEQIKAEVERMKKEATHFIDACKRDQRPYNYWEGQWNTAELINKKISTLQEKSEKPINPVCEGVEKEIERTANEWSHKMDGITISDMEEMFRHFYELGRSEKPNNHLEHPVDFPTTDEEMKAFLATHPKVEVPERYKKPDWVFEQPVCEGLEEEIERYKTDMEYLLAQEYGKGFETNARHFYELGRQSKPKVCEELEEEIKRFQKEVWDYDTTLSDIARHFAKWQKDQDDKETAELLTIAHLQGADQMREQMLQEAVEGEVNEKPFGYKVIRPNLKQLDTILESLSEGDKVRIIIVKED